MRRATEQEKAKVLFDDEIWRLVSNGRSFDKEGFVFPESWDYLTETGNEVFILSDNNQIHPNILNVTRGKAFWMIKRFLDWIDKNTDLPMVYAKIHKMHENTIKLSKIGGFEEVYMINDRVILVKRFER